MNDDMSQLGKQRYPGAPQVTCRCGKLVDKHEVHESMSYGYLCQDCYENVTKAPSVSPECLSSGISGMGKDAPLAADGLQSEVLYRFDLIDPQVLFRVAAVLHGGAEKYGAGNWRKIPAEQHINHAMSHLYAYLAGDRSDDHLTNAVCRTIFANATAVQ